MMDSESRAQGPYGCQTTPLPANGNPKKRNGLKPAACSPQVLKITRTQAPAACLRRTYTRKTRDSSTAIPRNSNRASVLILFQGCQSRKGMRFATRIGTGFGRFWLFRIEREHVALDIGGALLVSRHQRLRHDQLVFQQGEQIKHTADG